MTSFNDMLVDRLNLLAFPEGTNIIVLPLNPELDILYNYINIFKNKYADTKTHKYHLLTVYLVKSDTFYFDNRDITNRVEECIKNTWKQYNTFGNKMYYQRFTWGSESEYAVMEFEELDDIYVQDYEYSSDPLKDGTIEWYKLTEKKSINKFFGTAGIYYIDRTLEVELEYDKKPTEANFKKDIINKFCEQYNVILYEDG